MENGLKKPTLPITPKKGGLPFFGSRVVLVAAGVAAAADRAGSDWWSLQPVADVGPPELRVSSGDGESTALAAAWNEHPIDRFVFAGLRDKGLLPSAPAPPRTLIRRATFDLIGLPPTPEEVTAFLDACQRETGSSDRVGERAYEELIDRLLASPHYGEQWGRHWLDVIRFGESTGFERNVIIDNAWPFRDYIINR